MERVRRVIAFSSELCYHLGVLKHCTILFLLVTLISVRGVETFPQLPKILKPPQGNFYHGVFPGCLTCTDGEEDRIDFDTIEKYQKAVGQKVAWVYFSNNWFKNRVFPLWACKLIRSGGAVPYIRLMIRSEIDPDQKEPRFTLQAILDGKFDPELKIWAFRAREFGTPLIVEWGTEANMETRPWNGKWDGLDMKGNMKSTEFGDLSNPDGPEKFAAVYKHIVDIMREKGANNITWVYHVNYEDVPDKPWNQIQSYYPGDDYVDWIALSAYATKDNQDTEPKPLETILEESYPRLEALTKDKPIILAEMGCPVGPFLSPDVWIKDGIQTLMSNRWPRVIGFSWWSLKWKDPASNSDEDDDDDPTDPGDDTADPSADGGDPDADEDGDGEPDGDSSDPGGDDSEEDSGGMDMEDDDPADYINMSVPDKEHMKTAAEFKKDLAENASRILFRPLIGQPEK